jgi:predicted metalloprotease with PDZ domain
MIFSAVGFKCCVVALVVIGWMLNEGSANAIAQDNRGVVGLHYTLDLADAKNHYATVTLDAMATGDTTELMMPVWTPGSYLVREFARHIDTMTVEASDGTELPFRKTRKNRWVVDTPGVDRLQVSYRLYCNELSVRTNWVGRQFAVINGASTFITVPSQIGEPHRVELKLPEGWTRSATSLLGEGDRPHAYRAADYDELVDSPLVAGRINVYPFQVGGIEHQLVNIGESGYWDGSQAANDLKKVVKEHQRMWGSVPYDRYLFLNVIAERGGGLEHDNSTLIMSSRWSFRDKKRYNDWLSLVSHEFFHAWNIRRLRPRSLIEYDYENEVYTENLWIAEGITSYYEDLALIRAGLFSEKEFLDRLSKNIENTQKANGRAVQSLRQSSYDTWIKFYRPDENSANTRISYYSKGAVVAFLLDAKIRKLTDGRKSLDDVMRQMFAEFAESGYTTDDFRKTANRVAGDDLTAWFKRAIDQTDELDFSDLEAIGLQFSEEVDEDEEHELAESAVNGENETATDEEEQDLDDKDEPTSGEMTGAPTDKDDDHVAKKEKAWLGVHTSDNGGRLTISRVTSNSPATAAGLNPGDEIIAINDFRIRNSLDGRLKQFEIGDEVNLLIARRGRLLEITVEIGIQPKQTWKLKRIAEPTAEQQAQWQAWLECPESN